MNNQQSTCDPQQIERFLCDQLSETEQATFEHHLDACDACRLELEQQAAEPTLWREACESLASPDISDSDSVSPDTTSQAGASLSGDIEAAGVDVVLGALAPTDDPRMLGRVGGYEIAGVIGHGGMGVVLKGLDSALNRYVAIKVLAPHLATSGAARRRFAREARAAAAVVHENVVAIHCVAEANNLPYFVMPYIRSTSLQKRLNEHGPLGVTEILRIAMQTAAGLAAAHAQGLVHRDIKPANILLADSVERVKITDFGLARAVDDASLTRTGVIAGTPQYMSPEQARGESVDARSDLFSLGSVMYVTCTGRPPFRAETSYGILRRITDTEPRPIREINAEIPDWLAAIIAKLHAKEAAERFSSADELARLLEQCLAHVQQPTAVSLPEEIRQLAEQASRSVGGRRLGLFARLGHVTGSVLQAAKQKVGRPRQHLVRAALVATSLLVVATVIGIAVMNRPSIEERTQDGLPGPSGALPHDSVNESEKANSDDAPPTVTWHDEVGRNIVEFDHDVNGFEQRASRLWENDTL